MKDEEKSRGQLLNELERMRQKVGESEAFEARRRLEEERLRRSEQFYRLVAENATDLIWTMDMNLRLTYISPSVNPIRGYTVEEAMSMSLDRALTPRSHKLAMKLLKEELAAGRTGKCDPNRTRTLELEHICKDGSTVWSEAKMRFLSGPDGQPVGILGVTRDITERKRTEEKVRQYLDDLTFLSRTAMGFVELAPDRDIYEFIAEELKQLVPDSIVVVTSYDPVTDLFRVRSIQGLGKHAREVLQIVGRDPVGVTIKMTDAYEKARLALPTSKLAKVPNGLHDLTFGQLPKAVCDPLERLLGLGEIYAIGFARRGQLFGDAVIVMRRGVKLERKGLVETFIHQASVALERKRAEEALAEERNLLRTLMDSLPDYIYVKDCDGRFITANSAYLQALGARIPEEIIGRTEAAFLAREKAEEHDREGQQAILSGQPLLNREELVGSRENGEKWLLTNRVPLRDGKGKISGLVGISRDITEFKRVEEEKRQLQLQLAHAQKMEALGTLAGGIAHEFNNVNAVIIGYIDLTLQTEELSESARGNLEVVRNSAARGTNLTKSLLVFSRKDVGERKSVNLRDVVNEVLRVTERELTSEGIEMAVSHSMGLPSVMGDFGMLTSVVMNLVINARHAMFKSKLRKLTIQTGLERRKAFLRVSDTGCGIPKEHLSKLFEPFFTTKGALAGGEVYDGKAQGTGLGLSVCHGIIKRHGGEIRVESQVGQGTTFTVYLPVGSRRETIRPKGVLEEKEVPRILIADDEEAIAGLLADILGRKGYASDAFTNPREALAAIYRGGYSLAFVDLQMPQMRGEDLIGEINGLPPEKRPLPVILTGRLDVSGKDFSRLRVFATLQKPFRTEELLEIVEKGLAVKAQARKVKGDSGETEGE